jgi:hypothetical protein
MANKPEKLQVSERALFARINRKIHDDDLMLRRCAATSRAHLELGHYYLVNWRINGIAGKDVDLEGYGREVGALQDFEELAT